VAIELQSAREASGHLWCAVRTEPAGADVEARGLRCTVWQVLLQRTGAYRASLSSDAPDILVRTSGSMVSNWDAEWLALWSRP